MTQLAYCDASCERRRGEGPVGWAYVIGDRGGYGSFPGTINEGEYVAVIKALYAALALGEPVIAHSDSRLVVNQVNGVWRVNSFHLEWLHQEARDLMHQTDSLVRWLRRRSQPGLVEVDDLSRHARVLQLAWRPEICL